MNQQSTLDTSAKPLSKAIWLWLVVDCVIVFIAGTQLFLLSDFTNLFFAWTIAPSLSATFLGSGYWSSIPLLYFSSRQKTWTRARVSVFGILLFSILTLVATLMHIDRFHLADLNPTARFAAWVWLTIYIVFPPLLAGLLIWQIRIPGGEPPRDAPLAVWLRVVLALQGIILFSLGILLFIAPTGVTWAWTLTPLTGRAIAAWLIGVGVIALQMGWENDSTRVDAGLLSYALFGGLQLFALLRYAGSFNWGAPVAILYLGFIVSIIIIGGYGWFTARRASQSVA
jgi:hypothetical protein